MTAIATGLAVVMAAGSCPSPALAEARRAAAALAEARTLARLHLPLEAARRLRAARQLFGDDPAVSLALARLDVDLENYLEAEQVSRAVLDRRPDDPGAAVLLAEAFISQGQAASASAIVGKLSKRAHLPAAMRGRLQLLGLEVRGLEAQKAGLLALFLYGRSVLPTLERACKLAPDSAQVRYALGRYYLLAPGLLGGDARKAREELQRACKLDPACFECRAWALAAAVRAGGGAARERRRYEADFGQLPAARQALGRALALRIQP